MFTNAVARATAGHDVFLECEASGGTSAERLKEADSFYANAVAQAAAGHNVLRECEAPRVVRRLNGAPDGLYTNAVLPATPTGGDVVQFECGAPSTIVASSPNSKLYANAVVQATTGRDVFHDRDIYLVHAQELVSLQGEGIVGGDLSVVEEDRGQVPWILARAAMRKSNLAQPSCSFARVLSSFNLELLSSDNVQQLVPGARLGTRDVNTQTGCSPKGLTPCVNQSSLLAIKAAKGTARSGSTGPQTPEIGQDRGRSPSTDSVPSPEHRQAANCLPGAGGLLRIAETCSLDGATCRNPSPNVPTKDQPQAQETQPKAKKRRYMPKVRAEKSKVSRAKKPRRAKAADDEDKCAASPPVLILPTGSPTLLQMKALARSKKPQLKKRCSVKRQKGDEAATSVSKESLAAHTTGKTEERKNTPRLEVSVQRTPDRHDCEGLQCTDPLLQRSDETSSWQIPLADQGSSNLVPLAEWNHGKSFESEALVEACSSLPGNVMSKAELRNVLNPLSARRNGSPDLRPANPASAPDEEVFLAADEDHPSTPRGPATFVSVCQDFTVVMPPSSPPSPHCASDWNGEFSRISATSTRRNLNFDAQVKELRLEESESVLSKDVEVRNEPSGLIKAMSGRFADEESPHMAERALTGFELQVTDQEMPVLVLSMKEAVPLAIDSSERRAEELQIVAYDDGAKKMVVFENPPMRKRRVRYKPKVDLDFSTVKMFKTLTLKGAAEDDTEQDKASWEKPRQEWQNRARRFISIMRQVQGSRAFSRWKGSVVDSVGGAFLTQNVSDFLSSNAFMALRARFPARRGAVKEGTGNSTPLTEDQPPIEKEPSSPPRPERSTIVELKKLQKGEDQRQEEASRRVAALLSKNVNENMRVDEALTEIVEALRTRLKQCHIEHRDHEESDADAMRRNEVDVLSLWQESEELREALDTQQRFLQPCLGAQCTTSHENAMEGASASEEHTLVTKSLPSANTVMTHSKENPSSKSLAVSVLEDREYNAMEEAGMSSSLVPQDAFLAVEILETEQNRPESSRTGKSAVIQEKFANVVQEESISSLTVVGKEKVLATTLRLVLGKSQTTREGDQAAKMRALKTLKLRPQRALMRRRIDNYRYRQGNVSFRSLSGEARAAWEAGFVMKSQKDKWEPLRASILADESYSRDPLTEDCIDWEAVRQASVHEVADVIKNRGMNNALAGRMKAFLDRVHRDQNGSIDLEWIRKLPPEDAKAFLLSFRGVGLKSVECIRLLALHHPSFPVDTNVGRIAVRLGWVPLEPLPEETQLHLLELYPIQAHIQQYIWPRICTLDQQTLYELHYQMITFGKVFCTKSKPNCNACPLRSECKHYASSYASAKLLLKWPENQDEQSTVIALPGPDPAAQVESTQHSTMTEDPCIPIIEEPRSPEPSTDSSILDISIPDIEEVPFHIDYNTRAAPDETQMRPSSGFTLIIEELRSIRDIRESSLDLINELEPDGLFESLPMGTYQVNLPVVELEENEEVVELNMNMNKMATLENAEVALDNAEVIIEELMDLSTNTVVMALENTEVTIEDETELTDDFRHLPSQELILLPPQSSLAPAPKLKNVQRLRTVHFVYELPDNHPLLFEMDQREADDPCFYLLAIWSPDEVPETMPKINDDDASNPFASCENNDSEQTVRGTLLIPCKTAMRGWFPLNGTYFQVNEVFADHASSIQPIDVPRTLLWSLRRRFVYFSTAVSNLFKDMSQEEIQCCFQKGYVCLRAFDLATRQPKVLAPRLHQSGAKIVKAPVPRKGQGRGRPRKNTPKDTPQTMTTQKSTTEAPPVENCIRSCDSNRPLIQPCTF